MKSTVFLSLWETEYNSRGKYIKQSKRNPSRHVFYSKKYIFFGFMWLYVSIFAYWERLFYRNVTWWLRKIFNSDIQKALSAFKHTEVGLSFLLLNLVKREHNRLDGEFCQVLLSVSSQQAIRLCHGGLSCSIAYLLWNRRGLYSVSFIG